MIYTSIFNTFLSESFGISNFYINFAADFGETATEATRPDGGIGRRAGLKHQTSSTKLSESKVLQVL